MFVELNDQASAARRDQLIALAREVNAHFEQIHAEMSEILSRDTFAKAA
ncbi:hypothetical protein NDN68_00760 [Stenotrophomonas maltophilia]|nr:hypothetical protein [Stenotrophomonas maltophilia]MCM2518501.1 hypothetical protein [Stenotrophomonas maltophilia]